MDAVVQEGRRTTSLAIRTVEKVRASSAKTTRLEGLELKQWGDTLKLKRQTFKYIEREIYDLHDTIKEIKVIEYDIIHGNDTDIDSPQPGRTSARTINDTTAIKATELVEHKRPKRMKEKVNAILKVYNSLPEEKKRLIELYYWERPGELTWDGVAKELHIGRATAIRWRNAFVKRVAKEMGES